MLESALHERDSRLRQMIRRLDVDLLELSYAGLGAEYEAARKACLTCPNIARCRRWLDAGSAAAPLFCINLSRFERFSAR
jgi:hypothetical protein